MQQGMEANQESLLSTSNSSFSTGDSSLLSNYLHFQEKKAGDGLVYHRKPMIRSHSKLLLTAAAQGEDAEVSQPPWFASSNAALSFASTAPWASSTALKEIAENFVALDCSSQALSELDQSKGDSVFFHRTPSFSCIESSECYESGAETATINMNGESLHCSNSKEVGAWANNRRVLNAHSGVSADNMETCDREGPSNILDNIVPTDNKVGVHHNVSTENMGAFQHRRPLDNRVPSGHRVSSSKLEALDLLVYAAIQVGFLDDDDDQNCDASLSHAKRDNCASDVRYKDGFPVHLNSPILKKRVVRRARSAFSKQAGSVLQRLGISSPANNTEKKVNIHTGKDDNSIKNLKANQMQQQSKAIQYTRRKASKLFSEKVVACKTDVPVMTLLENGDGSKHRDLQASPTKASDDCNTYLKVKDSQYKIPMKQQKLQDLPTPELHGSLSKPLESAMKSEMCKDFCQVESATGQKNSILEGECREANSDEVEAKQASQVNNGGSLIRLKIRPMRLPSQVLQEENIFEGCELVSESHTITRRSERLHVREHERRTNVTMQPIELMLCDSSVSLDAQAKEADLSIRSKRARSQALPTKFSDSVLQPWKRAYRKKC